MADDIAGLTRAEEPYHFERRLPRLSDFPRAPQPNTNQPNQKVSIPAWGMRDRDYWRSLIKT